MRTTHWVHRFLLPSILLPPRSSADDQLLQFELIQKLEGHHGEIWALATSHQGEYVVTGSHDKSIRIWEKTEEPLFLEEERERELEAMYDATAVEDTSRPEVNGDEVEAYSLLALAATTREHCSGSGVVRWIFVIAGTKLLK